MPGSKRTQRPSLWLTMFGTSIVATTALWCYAVYVRGTQEFLVLVPLVATPAVIVGGFIAGGLVYAMRVGVPGLAPGAMPNVAEPESATRKIIAAQTDRACRCAAVAGGAALIPAFVAVRWLSRAPVAGLFIVLGGGVAAAFAWLVRRLSSSPSDRTLGVAVAAGWTSAAMTIGAVFGSLSLGVMASKNTPDGLLASTLSVLLAGGLPGVVAVAAVFGASVELGRSAWRVSQRQVFARAVAEERRDEWRAGARNVVVHAVIGFVAFVAASWVLVR